MSKEERKRLRRLLEVSDNAADAGATAHAVWRDIATWEVNIGDIASAGIGDGLSEAFKRGMAVYGEQPNFAQASKSLREVLEKEDE